MGKYHVHRSDGNAREILQWLEGQPFASVARSGRPTDAILGAHGYSVLIEIKTLRGALEPSQVKFLNTWQGAAAVLRTKEQAKQLLYLLSRGALWRVRAEFLDPELRAIET